MSDLASGVYTRKLYQFAVAAEQREEDPRCRALVLRTWIGAVDVRLIPRWEVADV